MTEALPYQARGPLGGFFGGPREMQSGQVPHEELQEDQRFLFYVVVTQFGCRPLFFTSSSSFFLFFFLFSVLCSSFFLFSCGSQGVLCFDTSNAGIVGLLWTGHLEQARRAGQYLLHLHQVIACFRPFLIACV